MTELPRLVLFARAPRAGEVKTRLAPLLTEQGAARLYRAFLEDAARAYVEPGAWDAVLAADPDAADPVFVELFGAPWRRESQASGDLGVRLASAFEREFSRGAPRVLAVGSDHPALPRRLLEEAFGLLARGCQAAVIPAEDGGYCAIGLAPGAGFREIFRDIPWSSSSVLDLTLERIRSARLHLALLPAVYDVDRPEDIGRLRRDLATRDSAAPDYPRATAKVLESLLEDSA
ncbi:MAG: TIGR04282 family arsenosugar biosynthesis glycosyltransferase [Thermoanaerobaculia bacterium]